MPSPKHKIFFGAPDPKGTGLPAKPGSPAKEPCFTWDTDEKIFSSETKTFDCDYDVDTLVSKATITSGFTWDSNTITMDTDTKIYN